MNNPYYNENQPWMHADPDARLRTLEIQRLQRDEEARLHALYMRPIQSDFAGLQGVSNQTAQQHGYGQHHGHGGVPWGGVAAGAAAGYFLANRAQQRSEPVGKPKPNVLGVILLMALVLHLITGVFPMSVATWIFVVGSAIWIPAWVVGLYLQAQINRSLRAED